MPFKIVQTSENNKIQLLAVPSSWENKNKLKWPTVIQNIKIIIRDENSCPNSDWQSMTCKVKRRDVPSYQAASKIISEMIKYSDTEEDIASSEEQQRQSVSTQRPLDLNVMAAQIVENKVASASVNVPVIVEPNAVLPTATESSQDSSEHVYQVIVSDDMATNNQSLQDETTDCVDFDVTKHFANQKELLENQTTIIENQKLLSDNLSVLVQQIESLKKVENTLIQKVATFSVQLENAITQMGTLDRERVSLLSEQKTHIDNEPFHVKPVENIEELNALEKQLSDRDIRNQLKNTYALICSGGKGIDCAYVFIDRLISRDFLCKCSWSGGSRKDDTKTPIKMYKQILSFFWEMVNFWDGKYTLQENESFFKSILRNANKRKMAKYERASTSRQREKKTKKSKIQDTANIDAIKPLNENEDTANCTAKSNDDKIQDIEIVDEIEGRNTDAENNDADHESEEEESLC